MSRGRGHGTRFNRDTNAAPNQERGGTYKSGGNSVRKGVARGRGHRPAQPWSAPGSNLVTNIGGETNPHMLRFQGQRD